MIILQNTAALGFGISTYLSVQGGTGPYTWAVAGNGSIDNSGHYRSGYQIGTDIITVTDSLSVQATAQISVLTYLQLLADIIKHEMELANDQVYIFDQKFNIPNDLRLYVAIGVLTDRYFGSSLSYEPTLGGLAEVQSTNVKTTASVNIQSRGPDARDRRHEIILALNSTYSQTQQQLNSFYIGQLATNFVNLSQDDGAAIPYRFNISVNMQYALKKIKSVTFFDSFDDPNIVTEP